MQNDNSKFKILKKFLPGIQKNILLKNYTTFKIGGPAKYFFTAKTKKDLIEAIKTTKELKLPFFILGGGSNLLISDKGYKGLIIKVKNQKLKIKNTSQNSKAIEVEAGTDLGELVNFSAKNNLVGLEWAAGIPGTVGGAVRGNAGAFGKEIKDIVKSVEILNGNVKFKIKNLKNKDCKFGYRKSIFKKNPNLIILSAVIQLKKGNKKEIKKKIKEYLNHRRKRHPLNPSAGSIFKNLKIEITDSKLLKKFPQIREFNKMRATPVGFLVEKCGLKGKKNGNVKISEKHCNFIINLGNGKAKEVIKLIKLIKQKVKKKFKINLEEEIQYLGF